MPDIKLVLTDIDGTIVPTMSMAVSDVVQQSIKDVERKGVTIAAVSARPYALAEPIFTQLEIKGLCVLDGGASVIEAQSGKVVWKKWLSPRLIQQIVSVIRPYAIEIDYTPDHVAEMDNEQIVIGDIDSDSPYVYAIITDDVYNSISESLGVFDEIGAHKITLDQPGRIGIQVTHIEANKRHGVTALRNLIAAPIEQTLAIGDGDNDIPLFENAAVRVAMGNATDNLKNVADHVVGTIEEDGFAEAMRKYVL